MSTTKVIAVILVGAFIGLLSGLYYAIFWMDPPATTVVDGVVHRPCGLAIIPMMTQGAAVGSIAGASIGFIATRFTGKNKPPLVH